jgi:histidine triad (HIT) family protein
MNCPFCDIDEEKTRIVQEGKTYYVALSNPRLVPGHLLIIPKRHMEKASELSEEERREIFDAVIKMQETVLAKFSTGCDIRSNYRPFLKPGWVKVNHLHFHLQPRELEDELYQQSQKFEKELWKELPEEEREKFTQLFS